MRDQTVTFQNVRFVSDVNPVIGRDSMVGTWNRLIVSRAQTVRTADGLEVTLPEQKHKFCKCRQSEALAANQDQEQGTEDRSAVCYRCG